MWIVTNMEAQERCLPVITGAGTPLPCAPTRFEPVTASPVWHQAGGKKSKRSMAVSDSPHRYGNSRAIWDHTAPGRGDIPAEADTRLSDPGGMQG